MKQAVGAGDPLFVTLLETAQVLREQLEEELRSVGLSPAKLDALNQLVRAGEPMPLSALAEGQRCVPSNMTTLVDRLENEGLVSRVTDPADRRRVRAALTPLGAERAAVGARATARVHEEFAATLPSAERTALRRILSTLRPR
jgi:DNA-binding MarR family transcriptional regulator